VLIRHGQSEGNLAQDSAEDGDTSYFSPEFRQRHTSRYRLTELGVEQAVVTGQWVRENITESFDRYYVSEYVRAKETASYLGFEHAEWLSEFFFERARHGIASGSF